MSEAFSSKSPLEDTLSPFTFENVRRAYCTAKKEELRLPQAISVNILLIAHETARDLDKMITDCEKVTGSAARPKFYDASIFEFAAYCHSFLEHCGEYPRKSRDEEFNENSPFSQALTKSCGMTSSFVCEKMVPARPLDDLFKRSMRYFELLDQKGLGEAIAELEWNLKHVIATGKPVTISGKVAINLDGAADFAVKSIVSVKHSSSLGVIVDAARKLHTIGPKILEEWRNEKLRSSERKGV